MLSLKKFDSIYFKKGHIIAGIDEAGRGALAGGVVAACVVMPEDSHIVHINDSKKLSKNKRKLAYEAILDTAIFIGIGEVSAHDIDNINILQATKLAMKKAVKEITISKPLLLIDGNQKIESEYPQKTVIKGDSSSYSIAAASIVAKETRDKIMTILHDEYPAYGFDRHKGYGTKFHRQAIIEHGPCPYHRLSFLGNLKLEEDHI